MKVRYFAWIQERLNRSEDIIDLDQISLASLIETLLTMGDSYKYVFSSPDKFCIAVNEELINLSSASELMIKRGDDVTFFPPISGG